MPLSFGLPTVGGGGGGGDGDGASFGKGPQISVEVAFNADPNSAITAGTYPSPTLFGPFFGSPGLQWTPLVNRVTQMSLVRTGRTDELGYYQSGTAQMTLLNSDGAFNPTNTSGPWYGSLLPYRAIRVLCTWAGLTWTRWQGFVERWPTSWIDPIQGLSVIQCVDAFAALNQITLDSAYASEVLSASPTVYYPLSEQSGSKTAGNQSGNLFAPAQIVHTKSHNSSPAAGTFAFGQTLNITGAIAQTGLQLVGNNNNNNAGVEDGYALSLPTVPIDWSGWTLEIWCQIPKTPNQYSVLFRAVSTTKFGPLVGPLGGDPPGEIALTPNQSTGDTNIRVCTPDSVYYGANLNFNLADNVIHHVVLTYIPGVVTAAVDGVVTSSGTVASTNTTVMPSLVQLGAACVNAQTLPGSPLNDGHPLVGTIGHFAIYDSSLTLSQIGGHYVAGATAFAGETSGARARRVLAYGGWQSSLQSVQTGRSTMSPAVIAGQTLLAALQDCADAELGTLTVTSDGKVQVCGRDNRMTKLTPTIVIGSNVAGGEIPYDLPSLIFDFDPTLVANDIQISRPNGPTAESADATSIRKYFPRTKPLTMLVDTDDQTQQAADWILAREKDPHQRVETVTIHAGNIDGQAMTNLWPALLAMDLHDRAGIRHRPLGQPPTVMDGFVEQLTDTIDASTGIWDVATQLSPIIANYLIWDDPVFGLLDADNEWAF